MKILVTRSQPAADTLALQLRAQGDEVVVCPALDIVGRSPSAAQQANIATADYLVFVSVNAVRFGWACAVVRAAARAADPHLVWCAVGPSTGSALAACALAWDGAAAGSVAVGGIEVVAPVAPGSSAALLSLPALQSVAGRKVVIVRGVGGLETLRNELLARGATVDVLEVYERVLTPTAVLVDAMGNGVDAIVVSSSEGLAVVLEATRATPVHALRSTSTVIVPSPRIAEQAQRSGWSCVALSAGAEDAAVLATIAGIRSKHGRA